MFKKFSDPIWWVRERPGFCGMMLGGMLPATAWALGSAGFGWWVCLFISPWMGIIAWFFNLEGKAEGRKEMLSEIKAELFIN